ncbi:MAG: hypothetical protein HOC74_31275 [Gemmatimonadetes bacterium]|nr:hypothetical protein [Gemmatimonadota bacterium]
MIDRLLNIDRRIIFVFVFIGVAVPLLLDFNLPVKITPSSQAMYDRIEQVAAEGEGIVLLSFSYGPSTVPEIQPMVLSILRHCFSHDLKVVAICLWPDAVGLAQQALETVSAEYGKEYGADYAFMGYKPGGAIVIVNMGQDLHSAYPQDNWGKASSELEVTSNIHSLRDFDFVIDFAAGNSVDHWWVPYGQEKYKFPLGAGCTAVVAPDLKPYQNSGQLVGMLGGLAGAAEYEKLVGQPGSATAAMTSQSSTHLILIAFIVLGNAMYFISRRSARSQ